MLKILFCDPHYMEIFKKEKYNFKLTYESKIICQLKNIFSYNSAENIYETMLI